MATNPIPEKLINFTVCREGILQVGVADVELPKLEPMSEPVEGAGIAGSVDSPVPGHYGPMSCSIKWRTITGEVGTLAAPGPHLIDFRGSMQVNDSGTYKTVPVRVTVKASLKSGNLGSFQVGKPTDTSTEFAVSYIKMYVDGKEIVEIDPLNFIAKFNGKDALASVRKDIGL
jgi:P2 family phage contractile tail tube protein